jgi:hypothetical protein
MNVFRLQPSVQMNLKSLMNLYHFATVFSCIKSFCIRHTLRYVSNFHVTKIEFSPLHQKFMHTNLLPVQFSCHQHQSFFSCIKSLCIRHSLSVRCFSCYQRQIISFSLLHQKLVDMTCSVCNVSNFYVVILIYFFWNQKLLHMT